jgi:hypothetical protein
VQEEPLATLELLRGVEEKAPLGALETPKSFAVRPPRPRAYVAEGPGGNGGIPSLVDEGAEMHCPDRAVEPIHPPELEAEMVGTSLRPT